MNKAQEQRLENLEAQAGLIQQLVAVYDEAEITAYLAAATRRGEPEREYLFVITGVSHREDLQD